MAEITSLRRHALTAIYRTHAFGREPGAPGVTLAVRPQVGILSLRGNARDARFLLAAEQLTGSALSLDIGAVRPMTTGHVFTLGPSEWWLVTAGTSVAEAPGLRCVEQSEGRTVMRLAGPRARDVLAKGCGLDLHPRMFAVGRCTQTPVAHIGCVLHHVDDATWDFYVPRSYARHFWEWLTEAASEFGGDIRPASA
ncbi:MAG: sarcosine oxidase subunit gamma [Burkholderiales bacterium]